MTKVYEKGGRFYDEQGWRLIEYDKRRNVSKWMFRVDGCRDVFRTTCHGVGHLVEENKVQANAGKQPLLGGYMRKVASVPSNIAWDYLQKAVIERDDKAAARWLNDSDNRAFRTSDETV